jgi:hypothetical protein
MDIMTHNLPIVAALALVISVGVVHDRHTGRWSQPRAVAEAVARLGQVPATIGDWSGESREMDPAAMKRAGIDGYAMKVYRNARTGQMMSVLLVCGRPGPISVHTPDICYAGAGYEQSGPAEVASLGGGAGDAAAFREAIFAKPAAVVPSVLQIYWSWNAGRGWQAPGNPRVSFAAAPSLYKLYLIREATSAGELAGDETALAFARDLLPRLDPVVGRVTGDDPTPALAAIGADRGRSVLPGPGR